MIGVRTGKVLSYAVRSKTCRVCSSSKGSASSTGKCKVHDCRKNWIGSAKAMEPDMVADMIKETSEKGVLVTGVVGDDDATTAARLKSTISHPIQKRSDKNHVTKNLTNHLYSLQKPFPALTTKVRNYLLKLFNYCISQHKHDPVGISRGLDAIVNHPYGDHSFSNETWCKFLRQPNSKYTSLPYGKPMKDEKLRAALHDVFGAYKKVAGKLSSLGSTQANESLNKSIASKAPKQLHFSGSASLNYRVAASVAQKNVGHSYLSNVNQKLGISPGTYTSKLSLLRDLQHRKRRAIAITRAAKQRRIKLKQERHLKEAIQEVREGPTYATNIGEQDVDLTTIPPPVPKPGPAGLDIAGKELVYFDLETTGLERTSHIVQIAAVHGSDEFSTHVMPKKKMSSKAAEITGLTVVGQSMFFNGQTAATLPIKSALDNFNSFLLKCHKGSSVILVGHNIESFDCKVLLYAVENFKNYSELQRNVYGFVDTYKMFKKQFPDLKSYKQEELVRTFLGESYMAHSALHDVIALQKLVSSVQLDQTVLSTHAFSLDRALQGYNIAQNVVCNIKSLQVSAFMCRFKKKWSRRFKETAFRNYKWPHKSYKL